jgi:hypothetical protein
LNSISREEGTKKIKESDPDKYWGVYLDIKDNDDSDFLLYEQNVDDTENPYNKSKLTGPYAEYMTDEYDDEYADKYFEWNTFWNIKPDDATEFVAEWLWEAFKPDDMEYGEVSESYFHVSSLGPNTEWDKFDESTQKEITIDKENKSENSEEDTFTLFFNGVQAVSGPMFFTFKGDDLIFIVDSISRESGSSIKSDDFVKLVNTTRSKSD